MIPTIETTVSTPPASTMDKPLSMAIGASHVTVEKNSDDCNPKNASIYQARLFFKGETTPTPSTGTSVASAAGSFTRSQVPIATIESNPQLAKAIGHPANE